MNNPFNSYPDCGRRMLVKRTGASCRREYGLRLQRITEHIRCVYCDHDLVGTFEHWLMMSVDHAIPTQAGKSLDIPLIWLEDYSNLVLYCSGCNGYKNRYPLPSDIECPKSEADFFDLRDRIFSIRAQLISSRRAEERRFYERCPWEFARLDRC